MQHQNTIERYFLRTRLLALSLCFLNLTSIAQTGHSYFFRQLTQEDGLLHNDVYDITQDARGFIWLATANGLQRYDGTRFLNFHDMLDNSSGSVPGATSLYMDHQKNELWLSRLAETGKLNLSNNHGNAYTPIQLLEPAGKPLDTLRDANGLIYILCVRAIFSYDSVRRQTGLFSFNNNRYSRGTSNNFLADSSTGKIWGGSNVNGLTLFDRKTRGVYTAAWNPVHDPVLQAVEKTLGKKNVAIRRIMMDSHSNLWIATWDKLFYKYQAQTGKMITYSLSSSIHGTIAGSVNALQAVSGFFEDNHRKIWVTTENAGLLSYNEQRDYFETVAVNSGDKRSFAYNYNIYGIFQDREENIWLGTDKGTTTFNPYRQFFQAIHHEEGNRASLPKNEIQCYIQTRSGEILAGTWGGGLTLFDSNWIFKRNIQLAATPSELKLVWSFIQNDDGTIWAGCQHGYILEYNPVTGSMRTLHPPELGNSTIRCMAKDKTGNLWFGLHNGRIAGWNQQLQRFFSYQDEDSDQQSFAPVNFIFFDNRQRCWVSSENGFKEFDTGKMKFVATYLSDKKNANAIVSNSTQGIEQYNADTLVIATQPGGLSFFSTTTGNFTRFTPANDFRFNNCYAVKKQEDGSLWFTSDYGLYQYESKQRKFVLYNFESGLANSGYKSPVFYPLQNGKWVTSTSTEIISFSPEEKSINDIDKSKIVITGVSVFDTPIAIDSLVAGKLPLHLFHRQNFVTIEFARLSFFSLHHTGYYYRLSGVNKDWVYAGNKSFAAYTNLEPGTYVFEVKSEGSPGGATSLTIVITPPFWKTWWFILAVAFCLLLFVYQLVRWRLKTFKAVESEKIKVQQAKIEMLSMNEKLSLAKLEALRTQMNPHFIFNCLTSIDNLIQTGEKEKATTYLAKFARLIRSILETSKTNTIPCWKDMETLKIYLEMEALRCDDKFSYKINISDEILNGDYKVPPLVIQPFVENAIHHGLLNKIEKKKLLTIDVYTTGNFIHYTIADNGVGRVKAAEYRALNKPDHQSLGSQLSIDRINLFNQDGETGVKITDLYNQQGEAEGTRVEVDLVN